MSKLTVTDPHTLAGVVTSLGGAVIPGPTFKFDLPKSEVREVIPKLNALGVTCENIGERIEDDPIRLRCSHTVVTIALYKKTDA